LIVWDGCERTRLKALLDAGDLPNLQELINEGSIVELETSGGYTKTKPAHAEMLTGYTSKVTNVFSNKKWRPIKKGLSVFERLKDYYGAYDFNTVWLSSKAGNTGSNPGRTFCHMGASCNWRGKDKIRFQDEVGYKALDLIG
jgi:predicted AlkP superfamily pyrophosphatase or phosphodiesterase